MTIYLNRNAGEIVTLQADVNADATAPVSYQWYRNGIYIPSAVDSTYTFTVTVDDAYAEYTVSVQNPCGQAVAEPWQLGDTGYVCKEYECDAFEKALAMSTAYFPLNEIKPIETIGVVKNAKNDPRYDMDVNNPGLMAWRVPLEATTLGLCDNVGIDLQDGSSIKKENPDPEIVESLKSSGSLVCIFYPDGVSQYRVVMGCNLTVIGYSTTSIGISHARASTNTAGQLKLFIDGGTSTLTFDLDTIGQDYVLLGFDWTVGYSETGAVESLKTELYVNGQFRFEFDLGYSWGAGAVSNFGWFLANGNTHAMLGLYAGPKADHAALYAAFQQVFTDYVDPECA